jgi:ubiquinone/menaquinone biosynthesis C-methylase UbiE
MMEGAVTIYEAYAPFYDGTGQVRFALLMALYLDDLLQRHPAPGLCTLDLACGTGTLAIELAARGREPVGLDQSAQMLAIAQERAVAAGMALRFVQGDMRAFEPGDLGLPAIDLVTCIYDSLNYLVDDADLRRCFACVARVLRPGGLFVFDMNTQHFLEHEWGACEVIERMGFVQINQTCFDPQSRRSTMQLTGFAGDDEQGYQRFDEIHVERAYDPEAVVHYLDEAGLAMEAVYDCFTFQPQHARSQRSAWVVRRKE